MKKLIVVSGGTKGIGKSIVHIFAQNGFDIVTCSRNQQDLDQLREEIKTSARKEKLLTFKADLRHRKELQAFVGFIKHLNRKIDVLVNNAGIFIPGQISDEPEGRLEEMIETNLYSAYHLTRGLIDGMIKRRSGYIFNICSTASKIPYVNGGSYCVSKFALYGMSKVLREEMKSFNVKVTSVLPGATLTASWEGTDVPPDRFMPPEDVAASVWNAYAMSSRTVVEEIILRPLAGDV
jgi:short-subunit dehydrogenase